MTIRKFLISLKTTFRAAAFNKQVVFGIIDDEISIDFFTYSILSKCKMLLRFFFNISIRLPKPKRLKYNLKNINNKKVKVNNIDLLMNSFNFLR